MATESEGAATFWQRCVITAATNAPACWDEYSAPVRAAVIAAVEVRRLTFDEIEVWRDDEDEPFPLDDLLNDEPL